MAQITPPAISAAPAAPQRANRSTFSTLVDAFVLWLINAVAQFAAVATNVYNNAVDAYNSAVASAGSAAIALAAQNAAALSAGASVFSGATNYAQYAAVISPLSNRAYRRKTAGINGTDPSLDAANWLPIADSDIVLLGVITAANSTTMDIEGMFDSTYDSYMIVGTNLRPVTNGAQFLAQFKIGGVYQTSANYAYYTHSGSASSGANAPIYATGATSIRLNNGTAGAGAGAFDFTITVSRPSNAGRVPSIEFSGVSAASAGYMAGAGGYLNAASAITGIRLFASSGNIEEGTVRVYGLRKV